MAVIMTVLVTIVMWMTAIVGIIFLIAAGMGLLSMGSETPVELAGITIGDQPVTAAQLIAGMLGAGVIIPGILFVCYQLRKILGTLATGDPFVPENASRLSRIAVAIALIQLLRIAISVGMGLTVKGTHIVFSLDVVAWASVAALFILSQVFREGTRLRDEEKMTI